MPAEEPMADPETSPHRLKEGVQHLKEWLAKQPHLPNVDDEEWLATFLCQCKLSLQKAKIKLDGYFSYMNKYPTLMKNRNPLDPEIILSGKSYNVSVSRGLTKAGARIVHFMPGEYTDTYNVDALMKRTGMMIDALYLERERHTNFAVVFNCQHLSYKHVLKSVHRIPHMVDIFVNAYAERTISYDVINAPAFMGKVVNMFKTYLPEKLADRIHVYEEISELLAAEHIDEDILCKEFGGTGPSLQEYDEYTRQLLEKHTAWFAEQDSICSNEELRRKEDDNPEELQGSFRKLEVD